MRQRSRPRSGRSTPPGSPADRSCSLLMRTAWGWAAEQGAGMIRSCCGRLGIGGTGDTEEGSMAKARKKPKRDEAREERISMEIVVDGYDEGERAMGWYYYLEDKLHFPFLTRCVQERAISPLRVGDEVEVV